MNLTLAFLSLAAVVFTAYWVMRYTKETQHLREDAFQQRIDSIRPIIVFEIVGPYKLAVKNIGRGPALDVELRLSQIHRNGGLTNLQNLLVREGERNLLNLGENDKQELGGSDSVREYAFAQGSSMRWGQRDVFAAIATYVDINRRPYYSVSLVRSLPAGTERLLVLKSTKTADYKAGTIEKLNVMDWFK
jgi:hypothetical protein